MGPGLIQTIKVLSADVRHVTKEGRLHAAGAELVHPERCLMLQGGAARVEGEVHAVVEQAAEGGHVEVGEAHQPPREVGGVVEGAEDAPELCVEQRLGDAPAEGDAGTRGAPEGAGPPAGPPLTSAPAAPSPRRPAPAATRRPGRSGGDRGVPRVSGRGAALLCRALPPGGPRTCMRSSSPVSACCHVSECMYCSVLMMRISRSSSGMMAPVRQPCRSMRSWGAGETGLSSSQETPHLPRGPQPRPPLPPGHCRGGPRSRALGGRAIPSAAGSQTGFPGGGGRSYAHCAAWLPLRLPSARPPQPPEAARPDVGLPFPAASGPLWALALAASPSHSGRGSARGRKASPPCALTPAQAMARVHSVGNKLQPWPCSQQATLAQAPRGPADQWQTSL